MYNKSMKFEWDAEESRSNKARHGIDFETVKELWLDENCIEIHASPPLEDRRIIIGKVKNRIWAAVYTLRRDAIRIISVRRAKKREANLYEEEKTG